MEKTAESTQTSATRSGLGASEHVVVAEDDSHQRAAVAAREWKLGGFVACGLASHEKGYPTALYAEPLAQQIGKGFCGKCHSGEEFEPTEEGLQAALANICCCVELGCQSVGHGTAALLNGGHAPTIVKLKQADVALEICPFSNMCVASTQYQLQVVVPIRVEDETDTGLGPGLVAVEAVTCQPFTIELELEDLRCSRARLVKVKAAREQVPLTIATASTLYTLQGTTTTPGLIYHFRTPRRISAVMKWSATYMARSRVQSLKQLRSIGLTTAIKDLIDNGPPEGFLTRFLKIFGEKSAQTQRDVEKAMRELGWLDHATAE